MVVEDDVYSGITWLDLLNHEKRYLFVQQLEIDNLIQIFKNMTDL